MSSCVPVICFQVHRYKQKHKQNVLNICYLNVCLQLIYYNFILKFFFTIFVIQDVDFLLSPIEHNSLGSYEEIQINNNKARL